jgi:hypothetical protein
VSPWFHFLSSLKGELKVKAAATQGNQSRWFFGKSAQFSQVGVSVA